MAWYDEAIFYHIYPLGLLDAPKQNPYSEPVHRLRELDPWIDHVKKIGCNAIYIGPLFESVGHGYETTDYRKLDSRLGDNDDLKRFVANCHAKGVRVIFDGVFNHTGRDFFAFQDIKQYRENSRYRDWYCNVNFWGNNEYNDGFSYDNWGGYNLLVKLNQRNPEVRDYILDVIRFWVSEFDVDGIRLDAADVLDFDFMKALRWLAGEVKPDFWLMGEVIHGDYTRWVNDGTLHSVTNYVLHKALYSGHNDHNYFEIAHTIKRLNDMAGNRPNGLKLYNFTDNHDVERIFTKLNNKANYFPAHVLEYTLPGIPSIYYGSEFGIEGRKERGSDASLRPALNIADFTNAYTENAYTAHIAKLGRIRTASPALAYGNYEEKSLTTKQYVFTRNTAEETIIVACNNDESGADVYARGIRDGEYIGALSGAKVTVSGGNFSAHLEPNSGEIFVPAGSAALAALNSPENAPAKPVKKAAKKAEPKETAKKVEKPKPEEKAAIKVEAPKPEEKAPVKPEEPKKAAPKAEFVKAEGKVEPAKAEPVKVESPNAEAKEPAKAEAPKKEKNFVSAAEKYHLEDRYDELDPAVIDARRDYESMSIEELQVAILEKMAHNGPVNDQMIRTVMENVYPVSLLNWVKSFR